MDSFIEVEPESPWTEEAAASLLLDQLSDIQREAVTSTDGPVLILAGAGSGKTRVITHRIAYLLAKGVRPYQILAVTFTNKAAREMRERIDRLLGCENRELWVTTFHALGARLLRRHCDLLDYTTDFIIYDQDDANRLIKRIMKEMGLDPKRITPGSVAGWIEHKKSNPDAPPDPDDTYLEKQCQKVYQRYQAELKQANAFDFADLLSRPLQIFNENADVLGRYQERWRYILIDEYQDTNRAQYLLTRTLAAAHHNLCVVGDEDQCIYSWRGADIRNILEFEADYQGDQIRTFHLVRNYRSPKVVLKAAQSLIQNNLYGHKKTKPLESDRESPWKVTCFQAMHAKAEAAYVRDRITELRRRDGSPYSDFAVFYRTHAQARLLEEAFTLAQLPYRVFGGPRFFERTEVKDLLAYLRLLVNPRDTISLERVVNVPKRGVGDASFDKLALAAATAGQPVWSLVERLEGVTGKARAGLEKFRDLILQLRSRRAGLHLAELVAELIDRLDYRGWLAEQNREDRAEIVDEFQSLVNEYCRNMAQQGDDNPTLESFLESVTLAAGVDAMDQSQGAITLMTLHNAKGLEFPYVFIVGMEEGLFPHFGSLVDPGRLEEERRLCYVGMTRAMRRLFLTCSGYRMINGRDSFQRPSRFLSEIDRHSLSVDKGF